MRRTLISALGFLLVVSVHAQQVIHDVIYLKQGGTAFTMDVFEPKRPNGAAIAYMVSGGWFSSHQMINSDVAKPFTDHGITVFEVVHGSQPKYIIPEILSQVKRAVRFIHAHAADYHIDPTRVGITGISSGGHLSLMTAGTGGPGDPNAADPVDRQSSSVKAVVAFMPPTDFLNWGSPGNMPYADKNLGIFIPAFGVNAQTPSDRMTAVAHDASPIYTVTSNFPPTLIVVGDSDKLVPPEQSKVMSDALEQAHVKHSLLVVPGGGHDQKTILGGMAPALKWFEDNL